MPPRVPSGRPATCVSCVPGPARKVHPPGRASGRPTAFTATARAAMTYCSMKEGDTCNAVAMLSKPSAMSSAGNSSVASISTARRSRTAFAYSLRLRRCRTTWSGRCGLPARSSDSSSQATRESIDAASGCLAPGGGMTRPRSLRTAFSNTSACWPIFSGASPSKLTPPAFVRSLWHPAQYCLTVASCASDVRGTAGACDVATTPLSESTSTPASEVTTMGRVEVLVMVGMDTDTTLNAEHAEHAETRGG